jgi:hypothetical protein
MVRFDDLVHGSMITSIEFQVASIPNEDTFFGSLENFGIMLVLYKNKSSTSYFSQVGDIRLVFEVCFIWGDVV